MKYGSARILLLSRLQDTFVNGFMYVVYRFINVAQNFPFSYKFLFHSSFSVFVLILFFSLAVNASTVRVNIRKYVLNALHSSQTAGHGQILRHDECGGDA